MLACLHSSQLQIFLEVVGRFQDMSHSPGKKKPQRPKVTRYGPIKEGNSKFLTEERFAWQKPKFNSDVVYEVPVPGAPRSVIFSGALRQGMADENPDAKKRSTGPGSYDTGHCYDFSSEYVLRKGNRFASATRESMAVKTPSPGAVYNIERQYWNGPDKQKAISFNCDNRKPLYEGTPTDADMLWPQLSKGPSITIAKRIKHKEPGADGPGAIYEVHNKVNFKTGPSFSFGRGRGDRFASFGFLPELD